MAIKFACPNCQKRYQVDEKLSGKKVLCQACGAKLRVPGGSAKPASTSSSSATPKPKPKTKPAPKPASSSASKPKSAPPQLSASPGKSKPKPKPKPKSKAAPKAEVSPVDAAWGSLDSSDDQSVPSADANDDSPVIDIWAEAGGGGSGGHGTEEAWSELAGDGKSSGSGDDDLMPLPDAPLPAAPTAPMSPSPMSGVYQPNARPAKAPLSILAITGFVLSILGICPPLAPLILLSIGISGVAFFMLGPPAPAKRGRGLAIAGGIISLLVVVVYVVVGFTVFKAGNEFRSVGLDEWQVAGINAALVDHAAAYDGDLPQHVGVVVEAGLVSSEVFVSPYGESKPAPQIRASGAPAGRLYRVGDYIFVNHSGPARQLRFGDGSEDSQVLVFSAVVSSDQGYRCVGYRDRSVETMTLEEFDRRFSFSVRSLDN